MFRKIINIALCVVIILCMGIPTSAATNNTESVGMLTVGDNGISTLIVTVTPETIGDEEESASTAMVGPTPVYLRDDDDFGFWGWSSLGAAMNEYGTDWNYSQCTPFSYNGHIYNHYYSFSDGSRMFFGVIAHG